MDRPVTEVCAQHKKFAMGEVEHIHDTEDERQTDGHEGIDNANGETVYNLLHKKGKFVHFPPQRLMVEPAFNFRFNHISKNK